MVERVTKGDEGAGAVVDPELFAKRHSDNEEWEDSKNGSIAHGELAEAAAEVRTDLDFQR